MGVPIQIRGKGLDITEDIRSHIERGSTGLEKLLANDAALRIDVEIGKTTVRHQSGVDIFRAEFNLHVSGGYFRAVAKESTVLAAIDKAGERLLHEVRHSKHRKHSVMRRTGARLKEAMRRLRNWNS